MRLMSTKRFIEIMRVVESHNMPPEYVEGHIRGNMRYMKFNIEEATLLLNITGRLKLNRESQEKLRLDLHCPEFSKTEASALGETEGFNADDVD